MKTTVVLVLLVLSIPVALGQTFFRPAGMADADDPLIVTGYRALFTCSAHFVAGRTFPGIENIELVDTQSHNFPQPTINPTRQLVVSSSPDGMEMVAAYRPGMGCTLMPPHWGEKEVPRLFSVSYPQRQHQPGRTYPEGDRIDLPRSGIYPRANKAFRQVMEHAFDGSTYGEGNVTVGVLVMHQGKPLVERYKEGFGPHSGYRTWSTAKSISAALIGIAVGDGMLDVEAPAPIPEWQFGEDPRREITLEQLLHMSSGLFGGGNNTNAIYFAGQDVVSAATSTHLEAPPGTRWKYSNNDTLLALRALRAALGDDTVYAHFPYQRLLHKIGMFDTRMEVDHRGNFIGSSQVYTTARDLGRFGLFLLNNGRWDDEQILPEDWMGFVTTPAPARVTEDGDWNYGAQFWLLDKINGVPNDAYTSAGNKGQYVTVIPSLDLVVVRTGVNPNGVRWSHNEFLADLIQSIEIR